MKLTWKKSELTGSYEANFSAKLRSISDATFQNVNKTVYRIANIELPTGKVVSGLMYESNFQHGVQVGNSYLCKAVYEGKGDNVLITVSHLAAAERASIGDFGFELSEAKETAKADFHEANA